MMRGAGLFLVLVAILPAATAGGADSPGARNVGARVSGYATTRIRERLDRGVVAVRTSPTTVYVGWRLLEDDTAGTAFNIYRRIAGGKPEKVNREPIRATTDFIDSAAPGGQCISYDVRAVHGEDEGPASPEAAAVTSPGKAACLKIPLADGKTTVQKIGLGDLDGDGRTDFVLKTPKNNIDPYEKYWSRSPDTYKLEAYRHDGKRLWQVDLGWAIERGIWYSPYLVYDFDGDGRAEVAVKTGEGDPRDPDGRVQTGPEYLTILDGRTGKPITRVDWIPREPFGTYNFASRNQLGVAYLDGKTPCLLVERGTYTAIILVAYEFHGGKLRELWRWDNRNESRNFRGQGAHWMHAADVDGDGRDEVAIGSVVIDDDGTTLWCTGLGHPDHFYLGKIDPARPGLQIYYGIESRNKRNGMCLVDARTGTILWGHDEPTTHIHSSGLCADIDPAYPGSECYSGERDFKDKRWLRSAQGKVISTKDLGGLSPRSAYWDADRQRELVVGSRIRKYGAAEPLATIEGDLVAVVDLLGDWREEILTSVPGELRIYTTTLPAEDRRPCLLQDPIYRTDVALAAMGYYQVPMTSYDVATGKR